VIADPSVSGQQSFVIDRGEQVHTLEAAKALLAAQIATNPSQTEEAFDDEIDAEAESEVETEETEGLSGEAAAGGEAGSEAESDGTRRRRRRRRRGRGGEARDGAAPREENSFAPDASGLVETEIAQGDEGEEEEAGEQPIQARPDSGSGERRPRRRGRRGGRRRRGEPEEGLAGSIADELGPVPVPEVTSAVADFDGVSSQPQPSPTEHAPQSQPAEQPAVTQQPAPAMAETESEKAARRRSTVREKVSFAASPQGEPAAPSYHQPQPASAPAEASNETAEDTAPRRAGWWSRRFGGE
jgi:ribonuclease E